VIEATLPTDVATILAGRAQKVGALALRARELIRLALPDAVEQPDSAAGLVGYALGPRLADTVCVISPQRDWVNIGFYWALELTDPVGFLSGTGKAHRHVRLRTAADAESPALRELLVEAVSRARQRLSAR
jgi:hypothetical protein